MRITACIFALFAHGLVNAAEPVVTLIKLDNDVSITFVVEAFAKSKHQVTDCGDGYICLVNDKPLWGTDGKVPSTQLRRMKVNINGREIILDTSGMFNPMIVASGSDTYQIINYYADVWKVRGKFSDGAAAYYAEWLIVNGHSSRVLIGNSESLHDAFAYIFKK